MSYQFSNTSLERLSTCEQGLQEVMKLAIKRSPIDFGIAEGHRSVERQQEYYSQGRTKPGKIITYIDGVKKKGKHNYNPSKAVDIYAYVNGKASWKVEHLCIIAGVILSCSIELGVKIEWGGLWKKFKDYPHFEKD